MLGDLLVEVVLELLGEAALDGLFPGWSKPSPIPPEGQWNASLGSVAASIALLGATFGGLSSAALVRGRFGGGLWIVFALGVVLALLAHVLGTRTFTVTTRRHFLAHVAVWLGWATLIVVALATWVSIALAPR